VTFIRRRSSAVSMKTTKGRAMRPDLAVLPPRYLRTKEAAEFLSLSARTLEKHRTYGTGPDYRKLGGRVVYSIRDLETWAARGAVTSTSDPRGLVLPAKRQTTSAVPQTSRLAR
jgi:predicted DNA-binding transcriptional regulator AlpA